MSLNIFKSTSLFALTLCCAIGTANASPRQEWESAVKRHEADFQKVSETLSKPSLSKNEQCVVLRAFWIFSEDVDYIGQNAQSATDQRRVNELHKKAGQLSQQSKARNVQCAKRDEAGAPMVDTPKEFQTTSSSNSVGAPLFGTWEPFRCDMYMNGALSQFQTCQIKPGVTMEITSDQRTRKVPEREPFIETNISFEAVPQGILLIAGDKKHRFILEQNGDISTFSEPTNGLNTRTYFRKKAEYVPAANESASVAPKTNVLPTSEELFKLLGLQRKGNKIYNECGTAVVVNTDFTDINNDGQPEIFALVKDSMCYGMAGAQLTLFIKDAQGKWQQNLGFPAGGYTLRKTKNKGFPDIAIDMPGMCQPIWRWDGKAYDIFKKCN